MAIAMKLTLVERAAIIIFLLVVLRLLFAAIVPLAHDEAYYWYWSKDLSAGYYDHPPAVAFVIRLGTIFLGDHELGVRLISVLLGLPMTWAVYRAAQIMFDSDRVAAQAAIFLNLTLMVAGGTIIVTPDAPLMVAAAFLLYSLAKVMKSGVGAWWLLVGAASGLGLLSKYNALFFGVTIIFWVTLVPEQRRLFVTFWPYLGGAIALAMFSPVIFWNAQHDWISFYRQFGRVQIHDFTWRYIAEFVPAQIGFATPPIFFLGVAGIFALLVGRGADRASGVLIGAMVWPMVIYFIWHSLHARVEANWLAPVYPAFTIAAALASEKLDWKGWRAYFVHYSRRSALVTGVAMITMLGLQASLGIIPLGSGDPTATKLGAGWPELADSIEAIRADLGASAIVTTDYATTAWLSYYLRRRNTKVVQLNDPQRSIATLAENILPQRVLYVAGPHADRTRAGLVSERYRFFEHIVELTRVRREVVIETYKLSLAQDPKDNAPQSMLSTSWPGIDLAE
jgi:4-amino-4-deoxy-L-arabinose transferase-like glycosyltransferase